MGLNYPYFIWALLDYPKAKRKKITKYIQKKLKKIAIYIVIMHTITVPSCCLERFPPQIT